MCPDFQSIAVKQKYGMDEHQQRKQNDITNHDFS